MPVKLDKVPLNRWGKPLRFSDTVSANCATGVHTGDPIKRHGYGYTEACHGVAKRMDEWRHCACACHADRPAIVNQAV